eukprot:m.158325 g.158325  ORF g.158325 m.158325 type:complete len:370 (+) comp38734_c1_seq1:35-1144(+)
MPLNNPLPKSLSEECKKAARILNNFTIPSASAGPDSLIPSKVIASAKGLAILTVVKAGFLISIRGGSGLVVAKVSDGRWSAPSAIGIAGIGGGLEIGAEITDFVIVLNSQSAVDAFSKGGNVTLGGNLSVAAGPIGRNAEADVAIRSPAAVFTYSKTRGLFAGISLEGSGLIERKDANRKLYGGDIRAKEILSGAVPTPEEATPLYKALEKQAERVTTEFEGMATGGSSHNESKEKDPPSSGSKRQFKAASYSATQQEYKEREGRRSSSKFGSASRKNEKRASQRSSGQATSPTQKKDGSDPTKANWDAVIWTEAIYSFKGEMDCDLSFERGTAIEVLTRTSTQFDWWEGRLRNGQVGIFPANYVKLRD